MVSAIRNGVNRDEAQENQEDRLHISAGPTVGDHDCDDHHHRAGPSWPTIPGSSWAGDTAQVRLHHTPSIQGPVIAQIPTAAVTGRLHPDPSEIVAAMVFNGSRQRKTRRDYPGWRRLCPDAQALSTQTEDPWSAWRWTYGGYETARPLAGL